MVVVVWCVVLAGCSGAPSGAETAASERTASTTPSTADRTAGGAGTVGTVGTTSADDVTEPTQATETETDGRTGTTRAGTGNGEFKPPAGGTSRSALVTRVIDGDTVEIRYQAGETDTVRLLGVDTPEVSGDVSPGEFEGIPDSAAGREHLREWATRASSFARTELSGQEVRVVTDPQADRRDRYGRLLAYIVPTDGDEPSSEDEPTDEGEATAGNGADAESNGNIGRSGSFNAALLAGGYARVYESSFTERERYERIEARAQERGIGLWGSDGGDGDGERGTGTATERASKPTHPATTTRTRIGTRRGVSAGLGAVPADLLAADPAGRPARR
jgi:micrococcal nuclease